MHTIFERVLMLSTKNYQNYFMVVNLSKLQLAKVGAFLRPSV